MADGNKGAIWVHHVSTWARLLLHQTTRPKQAGLAVSSTLTAYCTCHTELPNPTAKYIAKASFLYYNFACGSIWVWNMVSDSKGGT
jgi:hypothetical protein